MFVLEQTWTATESGSTRSRDIQSRGKQLLREKRFAEAESIFRAALRDAMQDRHAHHNLGVALAKQKKFAQAICHFRKAIELAPDSFESHCGLGLALAESGQPEQAQKPLETALRLQPNSAAALHCLGKVFRNTGQLEQSLACLRQAESIAITAEIQHDIGLALTKMQRPREAIDAFRSAIETQGEFPEAYNNMGIQLEACRKYDEAIEAFHHALRLRPDSAQTYNNLGVAYASARRLTEAIESYQTSLRLNPNSVECKNNLGNACRQLGNLDEAIDWYEKALASKPDYPEAFNNMGIARVQQGRLNEGLRCYEHALQLRPNYAEAHMNRALGWLANGQFEQGWREYEWRWRSKDSRPPLPAAKRWDGADPKGKTLLLHFEQGLGDTFQFVRYATALKRLGCRVILACQPVLQQILARTPGIDEFCTDVKQARFDFHVPLMSLPGLLGPNPEDFPQPDPYVHPSKELTEQWALRLRDPATLRIGIAWQGNPLYRGDRHRSVPLTEFAPLAALDGVQLYSLQKESSQQDEQAHCDFELTRFASLDEESGPFMDTAAIMANLDLIITSDTATAHLAGALGAPVWLATNAAPDWRWMRKTPLSVWYPTMWLFRQTQLGDWAGVFERMSQVIATAIRQNNTRAVQRDHLLDRARQLKTIADRSMDEERPEGAVEAISRLLVLDACNPEGHNNLGVALAMLGRHDEAVQHFETANRLREFYGDANHNLAQARRQT